MKTLSSAILIAAVASAAHANPVDIDFYRITNNASQNVATQFHAVLTDSGSGTVNFRFTNAVGIQSSISEIYYDDGPFLGAATLFQNGTNFQPGGASPGNLPGGAMLNPPFQATQIFSADAQGNPANGIDVGTDWLDMRFNLVQGMTFQDVVDALTTGALRIGLHVRAIGTGGQSDSFVNGGNVVPLPPAAWAGIICLGGAGLARRRFARG